MPLRSERDPPMRYASILVVVLISASSSLSQTARANEGASEMIHNCRTLERGTKGRGTHIRIPNTRQALLCWGYMQAMQDISVLVTSDGHRLVGSCPPEQITLLHLIHIFIKYERANPEEEQDNAASAVIKAFHDAFPCDRLRASAQK